MYMSACKRLAFLILSVAMLLPLMVIGGSAVSQEPAYAYVYDAYGTAVQSPAPYDTAYRIDTAGLGAGTLRGASSVFVREKDLYVCDSGNHRILQLRLEEDGAQLVRQITGSADGTQVLMNPADVFVTEADELIIADSGNNRILCLDGQLNVQAQITRPVDPTVDQTVPFKPNRLVMASGHIYVQATSINKGLMEFTHDGEFVGYVGASPVKFDWEDYLWKLVSTDAQRDAMVAFVPTEYNNIALDSEGFLFVTNSVFSKQELQAGQAEPLRRLNLKGTNILIENGNHRVMGDLSWDKDGPSKFVDVTVLEDGTYYALDSTRSRIFAYDHQGNMLYAFGGIGTKAGSFTAPVSIDHSGTDLIVLDSANGLITVLRHTDFGRLISKAIGAYAEGAYDQSMAYWKQVMHFDGSYEMAYRGIGKVMLRNGDYEQALEYLKYAKDQYYYSKAWKLYRKDWIEENIAYIFGAILLAVVVWLVVSLATKIVRKVDSYVRWHSQGDTEPPG